MDNTEQWFDDLVESTRAGLTRYVRSLVACPDDAQEILQDAYLKVYCLLKKTGPEGHKPAALLYTAARNLAISRIRHQQVVSRTQLAVTVAEELRCQSATTEQQVSRSMQHRALMLAVNNLPPKCRSVFVRRMLHGMSQRDIAEDLGISVSTVEKHLVKGLRMCRTFLAESVDPVEAVSANAPASRTGTDS